MKAATLLYRSPVTVGHVFTEQANSYDIRSHYFITWPTCLSWILATVTFSAMLYVCVQPFCVGLTKVLCSFCVILYMGRNRNSLADISFSVHTFSFLHKYWNFLMAADPLLYFMSLLLTVLCTCFPVRRPVSAL